MNCKLWCGFLSRAPHHWATLFPTCLTAWTGLLFPLRPSDSTHFFCLLSIKAKLYFFPFLQPCVHFVNLFKASGFLVILLPDYICAFTVALLCKAQRSTRRGKYNDNHVVSCRSAFWVLSNIPSRWQEKKLCCLKNKTKQKQNPKLHVHEKSMRDKWNSGQLRHHTHSFNTGNWNNWNRTEWG